MTMIRSGTLLLILAVLAACSGPTTSFDRGTRTEKDLERSPCACAPDSKWFTQGTA